MESYNNKVQSSVRHPAQLHSWPCLSVGLAAQDLANCESKIFKKKFQKIPKSQTSIYSAADYLYSIYIVLGIRSNPEMI